MVKAEQPSSPFACSVSELVCGSRLVLLSEVVLCSLNGQDTPMNYFRRENLVAVHEDLVKRKACSGARFLEFGFQ